MKARSFPSVRGRLVALSLALAVALSGPAGCLIVPVNYTAAGSRNNVRTQTANTLRPGVTTREDVLLVLGEPDLASEDGRRLGYAWSKVNAIWFVASYGGGAGGEIQRSYILEVSFDAGDRVAAVRILKEWGPAVIATPELDQPK
jgi:outer membrane protein assembly factor BamE (lipoprotein component of BamABCDE complex)